MSTRKTKSPVSGIGKVALSAIPSALAPWQDKVTSVELVSAYHQPNVAIVASILSVFAGVYALAAASKLSHQSKVGWLGIATVIFVTGVISCFFFQITVDKLWAPPTEILWLVKFLWLGAYFLAMMALGVIIAISMSIFGEPA